VRGSFNHDVREFKGIPYAEAPTGKLRWAPPRPAGPWKGTRDATAYGPICPQLERYGIPESSDNEDCLTLNVTTPMTARQDGQKWPVIVWIHGGGFVGGSSALYRLDTLAKAGAVVVSMNYRLGVFGFMAHPAFDRATNGGYGLEDQREALRWVQRNIAAFGGDPRNVTLAGESAGGFGVCMHLVAPQQTEGLFHRTIIQSAGCGFTLRQADTDGAETGKEVAEKLGCTDEKDALACLRRQGVQKLLEAGTEAAGDDLLAFAPVYGTRTVPVQPRDALRQGAFLQVPLINGGNRDELRLYVAYDVLDGKSVTSDNYDDKVKAVYGEKADTVLARYPHARYSSPAAALGSLMSDYTPANGINHCLFLETARQVSARGVQVFQYEFADRTAPPVTDNPYFEMGAVHSAELPYQFPGFDNTQAMAGLKLTRPQQYLAHMMTAYWVSFAATGTPSAEEGPVWEPFRTDKAVLRFENGGISNFDAGTAHQCDFWRRQYPQMLTP
jgi:para-nitrobenzyl esterase